VNQVTTLHPAPWLHLCYGYLGDCVQIFEIYQFSQLKVQV